MELTDTIQNFERLKATDVRKAAELAYAIARNYQAAGDNDKALAYGRQSIELFDKCQMDTMEQCAAQYVVVAGVALPDLIHQDVVRNLLKPLRL